MPACPWRFCLMCFFVASEVNNNFTPGTVSWFIKTAREQILKKNWQEMLCKPYLSVITRARATVSY